MEDDVSDQTQRILPTFITNGHLIRKCSSQNRAARLDSTSKRLIKPSLFFLLP